MNVYKIAYYFLNDEGTEVDREGKLFTDEIQAESEQEARKTLLRQCCAIEVVSIEILKTEAELESGKPWYHKDFSINDLLED